MSANNENSVQERVFPHSIVSLRSNGIIHVVFRDLITIGYKESKEINDAIGKLGKGKRMRVLMESAINTNFEKEAREFSQEKKGSDTHLRMLSLQLPLPRVFLLTFT
jgi:hypothetical protein